MEQLKSWSQFDLVKQQTLEEIQQAEKDGTYRLQLRYKQDLLSTHLAAAYDRLDLLKWFVHEKGMFLESCDDLGRTVSEVALASDARNTHDWIERIEREKAMQVISVFATTHFRGRSAIKRKLRMLRALVNIQAWLRGNIVREKYRGLVLSRLEVTRRFEAIWGRSVDGIARMSSLRHQQTWMALKKERHDVVLSDDVLADDIEGIAETNQKLDKAMIQAARKEAVTEECGEIVDSSQESGESCADSRSASSHLWQPGKVVKRIKLTGEVVKWLRQGDSKYRDFFIRRINQLAAGERSRILAKRLTGCKTLIFETYLEQKSGFRILWTENADGSLLIWYVAKHKSLSRLIGLIDDAESRSKRQLEPSLNLPDFDHDCSGEAESAVQERIMLDPLGDTPLKLYEVGIDEVQKLSDEKWKPRLYLTSRERETGETRGTILLLGRSGTGKTSVICNHMDYDRRLAGNELVFSQLFVSRSHRLRDYVREVVDVSGDADKGDEHSSLAFETFDQVVRILEDQLPATDGSTNQFLPSQRMHFGRFKRELYQPESSSGLDALVVWTNIRSFVKGSIEALLNPRHVLSESILSSARDAAVCLRISADMFMLRMRDMCLT